MNTFSTVASSVRSEVFGNLKFAFFSTISYLYVFWFFLILKH